jgi:hypothetical protein
LYIFKGKFSEFAMNKDEDVPTMFNRLNDIVNELKCLGFIVPDEEFSQKFLGSLPEKYDTIVTLLVRSELKTMTPTQILGEVITLDLFKKSQVKAQANEPDKKSIALKAKASKEESDDEDDEESDEEMALFVRRFKRMMSKRKFNKKGQSSKKNPFEDRKCYECGKPGHITINCPSKKNKKYGKKKIEDKKKKYFKKEKNGQAYFVEWDSDESSDDKDDKPSSALAGIAIKEAPSLFSKHHCLMAKGESKVTNDEASDDEKDSLSYDDLVRMISESDDVLRKKSDKIAEWKRKYSTLLNSYEQLKTSHENLKKSHEELQALNELLKESNEKLK